MDLNQLYCNISEENEVSFSQEATETSEVEDEKSVDLKEFGVDADELWEPRLNVQLGIDFLLN